MSSREGGEAKQAGGTRVSFSLQGQNNRRALARTKAFQEEEDEQVDESSRDIPLGVKRPKTQRSQEASGPSARPQTRVIPLQSHTDWRQERKARLGIASRHADQLGSLTSMRRSDAHSTDAMPKTSHHQDVHAPDRAFTEPQKQGLQTRETQQPKIPEQAHQEPQHDSTPPASVAGASPNSNPGSPEQVSPENAAVQAILSGHRTQGTHSNTVILQPTDEQMLRNDLDTCPDAPTLDHYQSMPIEEFGAAMLRGMGWKDGSGVGKSRMGPTRAPKVQRRAALLGLGAKERTTPTTQRSMPNSDRKSYTPALCKDSSSGSSKGPEASHRDTRYRPSSQDRSRHESYQGSSRDDSGHDSYQKISRDSSRHGSYRGSSRDDSRRDSYRGSSRDDSRHDSYRGGSRHDSRHGSYQKNSRDETRSSSRYHQDDSYHSSHNSSNYRREGRDDYRSEHSSRSYRR
ncbi:DNA primase large subunit Spp2 [Malassezia psittaci]|uniref:DNA primase large subunit Spp2 n=1 Tax=Malassezia psittaci TaxID=1821823 RepID=A0AAF0F9J2_9BASI|nr:DNA primase large subunit Spp2 [Malassezia psittaci]